MATVETTSPYTCPVCGTVHVHQDQRYKNYVCQKCEKLTVCSHGDSVVGYNTHPGGGFEARHSGQDRSRCDQVTEDSRVWIDGNEFSMNEARFGGIVVTPPLDPPPRSAMTWNGLSN